MALAANQLYQGDCVARMQQLDEGSVDLVFADPPFNIGYDYDVYRDRQPHERYLDWSCQWMAGVARALKPTGTFWLAIGDEYAAELKLIAHNDLGFTCRSWVVWYYTFGVNCTRKFTRSHAHLFHFVKDPETFTFNGQDPTVRIPSARQLVYADTRANPAGRLPDDTWILRPQDVPDGFSAEQDTWYFSRVAGTFKERAGFHGCQMPEQLLGRIIRASSNAGDLVLDPFGGSGTTLVVAKKLGRRFLGFELSADYVTKIRARLDSVAVGQPLDGPANPVTSAPPTPKVTEGAVRRRVQHPKRDAKVDGGPVTSRVPRRTTSNVNDAVIAAYLLARDGHSSDQVIADPTLNAAFLDECREAGATCAPAECNRLLLRLRKAGKLPRLDRRPLRLPTHEQMDKYGFASEIALSIIMSKQEKLSLDDVLCDPVLVSEFDQLAESFAPGFRAFDYRWAAFQIRKRGCGWKRSAQALSAALVEKGLPRAVPWQKIRFDTIAEVPGIYLISDGKRRPLYLGETLDLRTRLCWQNEVSRTKPWSQFGISAARLLPLPALNGGAERYRRGLWSRLLASHRTRLNLHELAATG